jgi:hypothetical protein
LGATAKKATWNSNRLLRFPKANLNVYITSVYRMPPYASPCPNQSRPRGPALPRCGSPTHQRWPRSCPIGCGACATCCSTGYRRGHNRRECESQQQGWETAGQGRLKWRVRPYGRRRRLHQGSDGRWDAMRALLSGPFCLCDGRRVRLGDLAARSRYAAQPSTIPTVCLDVIALVVSSCGYDRGQIEQRVAQ